MAKPDDRSDNVARIQDAIDNTTANLREAQDFVDRHAGQMRTEDRRDIQAKNERRAQAIDGFRSEIRDEAEHAGGAEHADKQ